MNSSVQPITSCSAYVYSDRRKFPSTRKHQVIPIGPHIEVMGAPALDHSIRHFLWTYAGDTFFISNRVARGIRTKIDFAPQRWQSADAEDTKGATRLYRANEAR